MTLIEEPTLMADHEAKPTMSGVSLNGVPDNEAKSTLNGEPVPMTNRDATPILNGVPMNGVSVHMANHEAKPILNGAESNHEAKSSPAHETNLPAIRGCIFDMDGLLINTEDIITRSTNELLGKYGRPPLPRSIRVKLMGVPKSIYGDKFHEWAKLPISREKWEIESVDHLLQRYPNCKPLPGAEKLLTLLSRACDAVSGRKIQLALASSSTVIDFESKTSRKETRRLLRYFPSERRILGGDDPRLPPGRGKPAPDIYQLALKSLNLLLDPLDKPILPIECLVFEDSVAGVESARRAGMRVVWVPHVDAADEYQTRFREVLAGRTGMSSLGREEELGELDDGLAECLPTLEYFNYEKYDIAVVG